MIRVTTQAYSKIIERILKMNRSGADHRHRMTWGGYWLYGQSAGYAMSGKTKIGPVVVVRCAPCCRLKTGRRVRKECSVRNIELAETVRACGAPRRSGHATRLLESLPCATFSSLRSSKECSVRDSNPGPCRERARPYSVATSPNAAICRVQLRESTRDSKKNELIVYKTHFTCHNGKRR